MVAKNICSLFIFVKSRWQQKTCYFLVWISQKKDRQTQHYFLSKALARQFDLPSKLCVTTAKFYRRKFPFAVALKSYNGKLLPTQFLVSSEGCLMDLLITLIYQIFSFLISQQEELQPVEYYISRISTSKNIKLKKLQNSVSSLFS